MILPCLPAIPVPVSASCILALPLGLPTPPLSIAPSIPHHSAPAILTPAVQHTSAPLMPLSKTSVSPTNPSQSTHQVEPSSPPRMKALWISQPSCWLAACHVHIVPFLPLATKPGALSAQATTILSLSMTMIATVSWQNPSRPEVLPLLSLLGTKHLCYSLCGRPTSHPPTC